MVIKNRLHHSVRTRNQTSRQIIIDWDRNLGTSYQYQEDPGSEPQTNTRSAHAQNRGRGGASGGAGCCWRRTRDRGVLFVMSARDQMTKMLDQLMGQNRDGEFL